MEGRKLERSIGLLGASATLIGYVVGASIFILPGELAPAAGPAVFLSYLLASVPALLSCFVTAQIGCVYPVGGAAYVAASRNLSPFFGFLLVWSLMMGIMVGVPLIAYGFVDYLAFFYPGIAARPAALATVLVFAIINLLGARLSVGTQVAMVVGFTVALLVFGLGGLPHVRAGNLTPLFPNGFGPVAAAAIPAFFSFIGFFMIAELAGEVVEPSRTIPRSLALSFLCVIFLYTLVPVTLVGVVPWNELATKSATVATAAATFLPSSVANLISIGALLAAATSLNGILLAVSRDIFALSRDHIFPDRLARLSGRHSNPTNSILLVSLLGLAGVAAGTTITNYAVSAVMAIMVVQILSAAAVFKLPTRSPQRFESSAFRLAPLWRVVVTIGLILYSLVFIGLGVAQSRISAWLFVVMMSAGTLVYLARRYTLKKRGLDLDDILKKDAVLTALGGD